VGRVGDVMFHKYDKTYRILVPQIKTIGKHFLSDEATKRLLDGEIICCEKLDGANVGIIKTNNSFRLQKRGGLIEQGEHFQFNFFKAWSQQNYNKIIQIPNDTILYGELLICKHTVFYDMLPDHFLAFAWYNKNNNSYYHRDDMVELCDKIGLCYVPEICRGTGYKKEELFNLIPDPSAYGHQSGEGLIVWNYDIDMRGKVVREEFQKAMDEDDHWNKGPIIKNIVSTKCKC
jgi:hypothetical protein